MLTTLRELFMATKKLSKVRVKEQARLREHTPSKELDLVIYWTTLLVLVLVNLFATIVITPFLFFVSSLHFYLIIAIFGIFFGYVFNLLLTRIENLDTHHHMLAVLFIPALALINLIVITSSISSLAAVFGIESYKDPLLVSLFYILFFLLPYGIHIAQERI